MKSRHCKNSCRFVIVLVIFRSGRKVTAPHCTYGAVSLSISHARNRIFRRQIFWFFALALLYKTQSMFVLTSAEEVSDDKLATRRWLSERRRLMSCGALRLWHNYIAATIPCFVEDSASSTHSISCLHLLTVEARGNTKKDENAFLVAGCCCSGDLYIRSQYMHNCFSKKVRKFRVLLLLGEHQKTVALSSIVDAFIRYGGIFCHGFRPPVTGN